MKKLLVVLAIILCLVGLYSTKEDFNQDFDLQYDTLMESSKWHHEYTSSSGNEVFWKNDGSEYFVVEVFGDHSEEFETLDL